MKTPLLLAFITAVSALPASSQSLDAPTARNGKRELLSYQEGSRGANQKEWLKVERITSPDGQVEVVTNLAYVELASGMHYAKDGRWERSSPEFTVLTNGYAIARQSQHKVIVSPTITDTNGAVDLQTPDGKRLRSSVLGLALRDRVTGQYLLIGRIRPATGRLVYTNAILFEDCFDGVVADVRFTVTQESFHQDVILRKKLDPAWLEQAGFNADTTRLEIWTEFFEAPTPRRQQRVIETVKDSTLRSLMAQPDVIEETLGFGAMKFPLGRAYGEGAGSAKGSNVKVPKRWVESNGRRFIVESMSLAELEPLFGMLPLLERDLGADRPMLAADTVPDRPMVVDAGTNSILTASFKPDDGKPGVVFDYVTVVDTLGDYTFRSDTTYVVGNEVYCSGNVTFEGGAVLKFAHDAGSLRDGVYDFKTGPYRPVIFTSANDNSVGETFAGSSGYPQAGGNIYLYNSSGIQLNYARICYAGYGTFDDSYSEIRNSQFVSCGIGAYGNIKLYNVLFANCGTAIMDTGGSEGEARSIQHVTADNCSVFLSGGYNTPFVVRNSILRGVGTPHTVMSGSTVTYEPSQVLLAANAPAFDARGAGNYYLTNSSPYQNVGTTALDAALLASLKTKTTHPPVIYSNLTYIYTTKVLSPQATRDTDLPDLGYHYDPIDYLVDKVYVTYATLQVTNGAVVAAYNGTGIQLQAYGLLDSVGTPQKPNWFVRYSTVQEQPTMLGGNLSSQVTLGALPGSGTRPTGNLRFTRFACLANGGKHIVSKQGFADNSFGVLTIRDCEFWGGSNELPGNPNTSTLLHNNLFARASLSCFNYGGANVTLSISNNLFYGTSASIQTYQSPTLWRVFNNAFVSSGLYIGITNNNYNAYVNYTGSMSAPPVNYNIYSATPLAFVPGPLGDFYQSTSSQLINAGSQPAADVGLYHYTVKTPGTVKEGSDSPPTVDIGYHYLAVDGNGNPLDSDADGIPDYLEDTNGNGNYDTNEPSNWQLFDTDGDGLGDGEELLLGTNPKATHSDTDGMSDGEEVALGRDPLHADGPVTALTLEVFTPLNP